jgi:hypothetical protein
LFEGPILIEAPASENELKKTVGKHIKYLWESSKRESGSYPEIESRLNPDINPEMYPNKAKFCVTLIAPDVNIDEPSEVPNFSRQSLKITLNPTYSRSSAGFCWSAAMPIDRSIAPVDSEVFKMDLKACLEYFAFSNQLDGQDEWFCPKCRRPVAAVTLMSLWSVPDVLIFHLKRFGVHDGIVKKSTAKVDFSDEIDMAPFVQGPQKDEDLKYRLFAVVHHIGTIHGGHYIATIRSEKDGWFTYNDEAVYPSSDKSVFSETADVLLYARVLPSQRGSTMYQ